MAGPLPPGFTWDAGSAESPPTQLPQGFKWDQPAQAPGPAMPNVSTPVNEDLGPLPQGFQWDQTTLPTLPPQLQPQNVPLPRERPMEAGVDSFDPNRYTGAESRRQQIERGEHLSPSPPTQEGAPAQLSVGESLSRVGGDVLGVLGFGKKGVSTATKMLPPQPDSGPGAYSRGWVSGMLKQNPEGLAETLEGLSHIVPAGSGFDESLRDFSREVRGVAGAPAGYEMKSGRMRDIKNLDEALTWAGETAGQVAASSVPSMVTGAAGMFLGSRVAGKTGGVVGAAGGAAAGSFGLNYGEVYKALKDEKVDPKRAAEVALWASGPMVALDSWNPTKLLTIFGGMTEARKEVARGVAKRVLSELAKGGGRESITEGAQEVVKDATVSLETGKPFWTWDNALGWVEASAGGFLGGAQGGSVAGLKADRVRATPGTGTGFDALTMGGAGVPPSVPPTIGRVDITRTVPGPGLPNAPISPVVPGPPVQTQDQPVPISIPPLGAPGSETLAPGANLAPATPTMPSSMAPTPPVISTPNQVPVQPGVLGSETLAPGLSSDPTAEGGRLFLKTLGHTDAEIDAEAPRYGGPGGMAIAAGADPDMLIDPDWTQTPTMWAPSAVPVTNPSIMPPDVTNFLAKSSPKLAVPIAEGRSVPQVTRRIGSTTGFFDETSPQPTQQPIVDERPPSVTGPTPVRDELYPVGQTINAKASVDAGRLAKLLGPKLYGDPSLIAGVSVKEMVQNSFDAIKALIDRGDMEHGTIDVNFDENKRTISIIDNGAGMTPETLGGPFLEIAGTKKETTRASGGLGIAKMLFLFGNKNVRVTTMRNGKVSTLVATGEQLFNSFNEGYSVQINVRNATRKDTTMFPDGSGTHVEVEVPTHYKDSATGETKEIPFLKSWKMPKVLTSPLFSNITVRQNGVELPIGKNFPAENFTTFADVKFSWGRARIYVTQGTSKDYLYNPNLDVLSNGLWQFSSTVKKNPNETYGENVNRHFMIDVQPDVDADHASYPFELSRQGFTKAVQEEFGKIINYMSLLYQLQDHEASVQSFGDMEYLTTVATPTGTKVTRSGRSQIAPKAPPQPTALKLIKPGDKVTVKEGELLVNGRPTPTLTPEDIKNFKIDPDSLMVDQSEINPDQVIVHDNVDVQISDIETRSLVELGREKFGQRFDDFVHAIGQKFIELRNDTAVAMAKLMQDDRWKDLVKEGTGISFDMEYRGVSIRVPFAGMFLNIALPEFKDTVKVASGYWGTMIHEMAHFLVRNHDAEFPAEMQRIMIALDDHPTHNMQEFKQKLVNIVHSYKDVFDFMNGVMDNGPFKLQPRGNRFKDGGSWQSARDGGPTSNVADPGFSRASGADVLAGSLNREVGTKDVGGTPGLSHQVRPVGDTLGANQRAFAHGTGDPEAGAAAVDIQPETKGARQTLGNLFQRTGKGRLAPGVAGGTSSAAPPGGAPPIGTRMATPGAQPLPAAVAHAAAHADRMNRWYKYMAGLVQLVTLNPRFVPLLRYAETIRLSHNEEAQIHDASLRIGKRWRSLGVESENLTAFINDLVNMTYRTPQEVAAGTQRNPTRAEYDALKVQHKLSTNAEAVFTLVTRMFSKFLDMTSQNAIADAHRLILNDPAALAQKIQDIQSQVRVLKAKPYFPFMRFGRHFVTVKNAAGKVISFETFERVGPFSAESRQQRAYEKAVRQHGLAAVTFGVLPETVEPFVGMPPAMLDSIATNLSLTTAQRDALEQLRFEHSPAVSFRHQFQHKNYVPGYSMDFRRAFARYFFHGGKYYARTKYGHMLRGFINDARAVPNDNKAGLIADYMEDHLENTVINAKGDFGIFKAGIFFWAMGYVVSAAAQNLTQTPVITNAFLAGKFGPHKGVAALLKAMVGMKNFYSKGSYETLGQGPNADFVLKSFDYAIKTGRISETQAPELAGMAQGVNLLKGIGGNVVERGYVRFMEGSAYMFEMAEQFNRRVAWRAALDLAMNNPQYKVVREAINLYRQEYTDLQSKGYTQAQASAIVTAAHIVDQTQFVYSRYARPRAFRGRVPGTILVFKMYYQSTIMMLANNKSDVLPYYALLMLGLGGFGGLPFYDDIKSWARAIGYWLYGKQFNLDDHIRKFVLEMFDGKVPPDIVLHGMARRGFGLPALTDLLGSFYTGVPGRGLDAKKQGQNVPFPVLDRSKAIGMGMAMPIDIPKMLTPTKDTDKQIADETARASGAAYSVGFNIYKAMMDNHLEMSDPKRWEKAIPRALAGTTKFYRAFTEGRERSKGGPGGGTTVVPYDARDPEQMMEMLALLGGYTNLRQSAQWDRIMATQEATKFWDLQREGLMEQFYEARSGGNAQEIERVRMSIVDFNDKLRGTPQRAMVITADQLRQSLTKRTEARIKREAGIPAKKSHIPIAQDIEELYPESVVDVRRVR